MLSIEHLSPHREPSSGWTDDGCYGRVYLDKGTKQEVTVYEVNTIPNA